MGNYEFPNTSEIIYYNVFESKLYNLPMIKYNNINI